MYKETSEFRNFRDKGFFRKDMRFNRSHLETGYVWVVKDGAGLEFNEGYNLSGQEKEVGQFTLGG